MDLIRAINELRAQNLELQHQNELLTEKLITDVAELRCKLEQNRRILLGIAEAERTGAAQRVQ
ncbi:MAG TPA: hypothetical protein PLK67_12755 [Bryobacteraceae bacterium]|nr:hypothetical protein [Bryobacteraceae bacterium]